MKRAKPIILFSLSFFTSTVVVAEEAIDFARDIRPILSDNCIYCHGPDEENREAGLRLDLKDEAFADRDGVIAFVPGDLKKSESWYRIATDDDSELMPPPKSNKKLTSDQKELIKRWIESGAEWTEHWSFVAPAKPDIPQAGSKESLSPIDQFIRKRISGSKLEPSPEADRRTLIRRVTLDLAGLPPTREEVEAFLADDKPGAYERLVDRLLASKHFGERMATYWLDAARYGDTSVMHADGPRDMWPWRDWVVSSFNENKPFDEFSIEQIAGDLLPGATLSQKIASAFNRNHPSSDEGGAIAEELRVSYVVDRVKTTSNVWLGLSMECGQCHDHKYDPISQKEYYQFYAYFNNTTDPGMQTRKGNQAPMIEVMTNIEEDKLAVVDKQIEDAKSLSEKRKALTDKQFAEWVKNHPGKKEPDADLPQQFADMLHHYPLDETEGKLVIDTRRDADGVAASKEVAGAGDPESRQAVKFDGSNPVTVPGFTEFDNKSAFTMSAWIRTEGTGGGAICSKMDDKNSYRGFDFWLQGGKPGTHIVNTWPKNALKVVSKQTLTPGEWHHVAISYDGAGKPEGIKIYVDGKATDTTVEAKSLTKTIKTEQPFRIGSRSTGAFFKGDLDDLRFYKRALKPEEIAWTQRDLASDALETLAAKRSREQKQLLQEQYRVDESKAWRNSRVDELLASIEKERLLQGKTTVMVMEDNPVEKMRPTFLLNRGAYDQPDEEEKIQPGIPAILPPLPPEAPANRLGLARWLFADEHPLTSRVVANQIWQLFFGTGIVETPADFGSQGAFPSHPQLLDWLAVDFRENGWDTKRLIRQIVLSATYRQSSEFRRADLANDPENRYLARAPRPRLQAEFIRDNALDLAGMLLRDELGGPGVKPYQPPGLWAEVGLGGNPKFVQDHEDKLYRRSLYTYWKRSAPPPAMQIFDAPTRETCVLKRPSTNTPLQALAAMNDVQILEASRHFAERIVKEGGQTPESRAKFAFETATAREPNSREVSAILDVYQQGLDKYRKSPESAQDLLSAGESERDESLDKADHASWTLVASMILNLDEVLTRN